MLRFVPMEVWARWFSVLDRMPARLRRLVPGRFK